VKEFTTIRRLLIIGDDEFATRAVDETAAAFGLLVRRVPTGAGIEPALEGFGPDAVIFDSAAYGGSLSDMLRALAGAGADLLLLGRPDDAGVKMARDLAVAEGLTVAGILAKPIAPEGLEAALRAMAGEQVYTAADIAAAVMRGEITAWYQLQLLRRSSGWTADGAETLARWRHPEHGIVLPDAFVPVAEAEGQIAAITDCVLQSSVQQLGVWHRAGMPLRVGVNLSPSLVTDPDFPDRLARLVIEYEVPARALVLEIPEAGLIDAPAGFLAMLARLRVHGFGLALEHFGSGTSSLADLYRTPFSELKIDRRLISLLDEDEDARRLVRGIIALAHELALETTAEAVETQESLDFLHQARCDRVQGFVISRPLPATAFQTAVPRWR
jgi:EAL domain-containing protein (putative c-di-GMP-specific phosphodiesterase class I)